MRRRSSYSKLYVHGEEVNNHTEIESSLTLSNNKYTI